MLLRRQEHQLHQYAPPVAAPLVAAPLVAAPLVAAPMVAGPLAAAPPLYWQSDNEFAWPKSFVE